MGRRADQLLAQRLRQAPPLHRAAPGLRRRLPRTGRRHRDGPWPARRRLAQVPLEHPAKITTHPLTYWRAPLAGAVDLLDQFPHASLAVVDDAGHALPHEQPELLRA